MKPPSRVDHAIGAVLALGYVAILLYTAPALGLSRDESMYVTAAESYAQWFRELASDPAQALTRKSIDARFRVNSEHPPLVKSLFALSYLLDREFSLFTRESLPFRFIGMLSAGLLLWLIHVFGTRLYGRTAGLFAALGYALLPRPFYHAHLDCFDVPITLAVTACAYSYLRALESFRWVIALGVTFGLALATKHNSWVLPGIFAIHFAFVVAIDRFRARRLGRAPAVRARPDWLFSMLVLGPLIFVASWPWLWHDTLDRIGAYAAFHLHHEYYNIEYFGVNYFWPPFPIGYPWVMTLYTVPLTTLCVALLGVGIQAHRNWKSLVRPKRGQLAERHLPALLLLGCMLAPLLLISLPSTPIFGGTKHWFTAYPFMALFFGCAVSWLMSRAGLLPPADAAEPRRARWRGLAGYAFGAVLLMPGLVETAHSHPFGLSHYTAAAGFVPGAADRGMNRQFWGFTTGSIADFLDRTLPNGGRVYVCDMTGRAFRMLADDGLLSPRIRPTGSIARADYAIVHHEKHFAEVDHQIWTLYGTVQPAFVLTYDGVPIISVYENPKHD